MARHIPDTWKESCGGIIFSGVGLCRRGMAFLLFFLALFHLCAGALSDEEVLVLWVKKALKSPDLEYWKLDGGMCGDWQDKCTQARGGYLCGFAIYCTPDNSSVTDLYFYNLETSGYISPNITRLSSLATLTITNTSIVGPMPRFRSLKNLVSLELSDNPYLTTSLASIFRSSPRSLTNMKLNDNKLGGAIPPLIGNFTLLENLQLQNNDLIGPLPPEMAALTKLMWLQVDGNQLNGTIPKWFGGLTNLNYLVMAGNSFEGPIPREMATLVNLTFLDLRENELSGPIPTDWSSFAMTSLLLSSNSLNGSIPASVAQIGVDSAPYILELKDNELSGQIPPAFKTWSNAGYNLYLSGNLLTGPIPFKVTSNMQFQDNCFTLESLKCRSAYAPKSPPPPPLAPAPPLPPASPLDAPSIPPSDPGVPGPGLVPPPPTPRKHQTRAALILGASAGALTLLILSIAALLVCCRKHLRKRIMRRFFKTSSKSKWGDFSDITKFELEGNILFSLKSIKAMTDDFAPENFLGQGSFGQVYRGSLPGGKLVAVKRLMYASKRAEEEFKNEAFVINRVRHKNLVALRGFCAEQGERILVMDYMKGGGLDTALFKVEDKRLDWPARKRIILGTARALAYLHHDGPIPIIHRDIKAANVLLDEYLDPHVADFGLARLLPKDETHVSTAVGGTFGYLPPEYVFKQQLSIKVDVYSFGILLLELLAGRQNISPQQEENVVLLFEEVWHAYLDHQSILENIVDARIRLQMTEAEAIQWAKVGLSCIQSNPADRPTMVKVVSLLEEYMSSGVDSMHSHDPFDPMSSTTSSRSASSRSTTRMVQSMGRMGWGGGGSGSMTETNSTTSYSIPSKSVSGEVPEPESPGAWPSRSVDLYGSEGERVAFSM